jgi:hypothetical protein
LIPHTTKHSRPIALIVRFGQACFLSAGIVIARNMPFAGKKAAMRAYQRFAAKEGSERCRISAKTRHLPKKGGNTRLSAICRQRKLEVAPHICEYQ